MKGFNSKTGFNLPDGSLNPVLYFQKSKKFPVSETFFEIGRKIPKWETFSGNW